MEDTQNIELKHFFPPTFPLSRFVATLDKVTKVSETRPHAPVGENPEGFRAVPTNRAALQPSGFSPGVSERELQKVEGGFLEL
jgi:hypothetical protein